MPPLTALANTNSTPPSVTVALIDVPLGFTFCRPPLDTAVALAVPPETTSSVAPLLTVVLTAVPLPYTSSMPPLFSVVKLAMPPE